MDTTSSAAQMHALAVGILVALAVLNMARWVTDDRMPPGDFAGYAASVREVRDDLLRDGAVPTWCSRCYGGTTSFVSRLKEHLAFPLALVFDPVRATKLMFFASKLGAALAMYALFVRLFGSPGAGVVAGYAYGFGTGLNSNLEHLEVHLSALLLPLFLGAWVDVLATGRRSRGATVGAFAAWQLCLSQVQLIVMAILALLVLVLRPWRGGGRDAGWKAVASAIGVGAGVFVCFAGSQILWLALDARNHALLSSQAANASRFTYIEHSPLLYVNRGGLLTAWLRPHLPVGVNLDLDDPVQAGRHYLGLVAIAVVVAGWVSTRRDRRLRRWLLCGLVLLLAQLWLATGPRTHLWQIAEGFGWGSRVELLRSVATALGATALLAVAASAFVRRRRGRDPALTPTLETGLLAGAVCLGSAYPLFELARPLLPWLDYLRSPGHFVDLAPFSMALLLGVSLVACGRARPSLRLPVLLAVGLLVVVDHWPSTRAFDRGTPMDTVRAAEDAIRALPGDGGTLRIAVLPGAYWPLGDYLASASEAGTASGWLPWQAGRHWKTFVFAGVPRPTADAQGWAAAEPLGEAGRVKYLLGRGADGPPQWSVRWQGGDASVWERPRAAPMARAYGAWVTDLVDDHDEGDGIGARQEVRLAAQQLASDRALVAIPSEASARFSEIIQGAAAVARGHRVAVGGATAAAPPRAVDYRRPASDHIVLDTDAGPAAAMVVVSESYHPWWTSRVDGASSAVVRAISALMAVRVPPGRHAIELRFEPPVVLRAADLLLKLAWIVLAVAWSRRLVTRALSLVRR